MESQPLYPKDDKPPPYSAVTSPPGPSSWQPPPGYYPSNTVLYQGTPIPSYGTTTIYYKQPEIIVVGGCPACRDGILEVDYTCLGLFCAIFFFPIGLLCCLLLKSRRCSNCGAYFD